MQKQVKLEDLYRTKIAQKGLLPNSNIIRESIYIPPKRATQPNGKPASEPRSLGGIYGAKVATKGRVLYTTGNGDGISEAVQRDPESLKLESAVNTKMADALKAVVPVPVRSAVPYKKVAMVSYEDAIRELSNHANSLAKS